MESISIFLISGFIFGTIIIVIEYIRKKFLNDDEIVEKPQNFIIEESDEHTIVMDDSSISTDNDSEYNSNTTNFIMEVGN